MGKVVHRIYAPFVPGSMMMNMSNTVNNRIAHIEVGGSHIDFCTQNHSSVGEFTCRHSPKQVKAFLFGTVSVRAFFSGFGKSSSVLSYFVSGKLIYVGFVKFYELYGTFMDKIKVIRCKIEDCPMFVNRAI